MKRTLAMLSVAALGTVGALAFAGTASATAVDQDCKTGSVSITDRVDSAAAGPYNWAKDTFTRKFEVCHIELQVEKKAEVVVPGWFYSVKLWDNGTFKTMGVKSPQNGNVMLADISGSFHGALDYKTGLSVSGAFEAPANWQGWTAPTNTNTLDTTHWIKHLFTNGDESTVSSLEFKWGWKYKICTGEYWLNAYSGNKGDITGLFKRFPVGCVAPPVFTDKCDESTDIALMNVGPAPGSVVLYIVNTLPDTKVFVKGSESPKHVTVKPEAHVTEVKYFDGKKWIVVEHTWTEPKGCQTPTPTPSTSTSTPGTVPGLPVTGSSTPLYAGGTALILLGGGLALFLIARKRRVKFEA